MTLARDIEIELHAIPTELGGSKVPLATGARPQFFYRNRDWDAQHTYIDGNELRPGESAHAYLTFLRPELHIGHVYEGMPFLIRYGYQVVAYGRVLRIIDLESSALRGHDGHTGRPSAAV